MKLSTGFILLVSSVTGVYSQCEDQYAVCKSRKVFPVTTDLNAYYSSAEGKSGDDLKAALNSIISGHQRYSYNCGWTALAELDKGDAPDTVRGIYVQQDIPRLNRSGCVLADGSRNNNPDAWNREHLFPKVRFIQKVCRNCDILQQQDCLNPIFL